MSNLDTKAVPELHEGGCTCGAMRYRITGQPLSLTACHCTECQRSTGSAFGMSMLLLKSAFTLVAGDPQVYTITFPEDGRQKFAKFCGQCGARLWTEFSKFPQIMNVKPGTLDNPKWLKPIAHIWLRSRQPWVPVPDDVLRFEGQPADFSPILEAWAAHLEELHP